MREPKRLLELTDATTNAERAVLAAGLNMGPSNEQLASLTSALSAKFPGALNATALANVHAKATASIALKIAVFSIFVGAGVLLADVWTRPSPIESHLAIQAPSSTEVEVLAPPVVAPLPSSPAPVVNAAPPRAIDAPAPAASSPVLEISPPQTQSAIDDQNSVPQPMASAKPASTLRAESLSLQSIRDALRSGNVEAARSLMETHTARFPDGGLVQERRALDVELLRREGELGEARAAAESFLKDYPASPHAPAVRANGMIR